MLGVERDDPHLAQPVSHVAGHNFSPVGISHRSPLAAVDLLHFLLRFAASHHNE